MSLDTLFDETLEPFVLPATPPPPRPKPEARTVQGWVKTYQQTAKNALPTLNYVNGDGNEYRDAVFVLAAGVSVGEYEVSKCRGIQVPVEKDLISLYEAVERGFAWEHDPSR